MLFRRFGLAGGGQLSFEFGAATILRIRSETVAPPGQGSPADSPLRLPRPQSIFSVSTTALRRSAEGPQATSGKPSPRVIASWRDAREGGDVRSRIGLILPASYPSTRYLVAYNRMGRMAASPAIDSLPRRLQSEGVERS